MQGRGRKENQGLEGKRKPPSAFQHGCPIFYLSSLSLFLLLTQSYEHSALLQTFDFAIVSRV